MSSDESEGTIGKILDVQGGYGPGFDFLRLFLAISVMFGHTIDVLGVAGAAGQFIWYATYSVLAMFFALGGFLVASSATRLKLGDFIINRSLRVVPALAVEVILSVIILGPLLTTLPLMEYLTDSRPYIYILNIVGWVSYDLPGVFKTHPTSYVNVSLWTIPFEYGFYCLLAAFMIFRWLGRPFLIACVAVVSIVIGMATAVAQAITNVDVVREFGWAGQVVTTVFCGPGSRLLVAFLIGTVFYLCRHRITYSKTTFLICLGFCSVISCIDPTWWFENLPLGPSNPVLNLLMALPLTYVTVFIGISTIKLPRILSGGDYSYGVYLYAFPIQQTLYAINPTNEWFGIRLLVQIVVVLPLAILSWHYIEKPVLKMRQKFSFIARRRLGPDE